MAEMTPEREQVARSVAKVDGITDTSLVRDLLAALDATRRELAEARALRHAEATRVAEAVRAEAQLLADHHPGCIVEPDRDPLCNVECGNLLIDTMDVRAIVTATLGKPDPVAEAERFDREQVLAFGRAVLRKERSGIGYHIEDVLDDMQLEGTK